MKYSCKPSKLFDMLYAATGNGLPKPVIRLTCNGTPIKLKLYKDKIYVNGADFGTTYATLTRDTLYADHIAPCPDLPKMIAMLCADPQRVIAAYGHNYGNCSFCGRDLSTDESTHVGYGPICAEKYGLPWGHTA